MSKKDYKKFAELIASRLAVAEHNENAVALKELESIEAGIINIFANDNPAFDRQKFSEFVAKQRTIKLSGMEQKHE